MSFLMDALRKAEERKQKNNTADPDAGGLIPLALEPLAVAPASHALPLPLLAAHLDSLNADLAATSAASLSGPAMTPPGNKRSPASPAQTAYASSHEEQERSAAQNLCAVKRAQQARARRWRFLGLLGAALLGIGGYFWGQMQWAAKGSFVRPLQSAPVAAITLPVAPTAPTEPPPAHLSALVADLVGSASAAEVQAKPEGTVRALPQQAPSDTPIRLISTRPPKTNPTLERAYQALQADQASDARRDYEQVLRADARNVDALLGLATLAARQGQAGDATDLYLRALEADPKDIHALAGLINFRGQADPGSSESRLKTLLARQPDSAVLNFVLGNLQAGQNRWSDAQHAYFRAYTTEPDNADYLYNLAVSLDHLQQNKLAAQYYQSALNTAGARPSAFDKKQVERRLLDLQP